MSSAQGAEEAAAFCFPRLEGNAIVPLDDGDLGAACIRRGRRAAGGLSRVSINSNGEPRHCGISWSTMSTLTCECIVSSSLYGIYTTPSPVPASSLTPEDRLDPPIKPMSSLGFFL